MNHKGLFALAMGTFALGIAEFLMMGILLNMSRSLGVSVAEAGHLISAYALGVCVGAPVLLLFRRMSLKGLSLMLAALITVGNLLAAVAPGYWMLFAARFIAGLPHGGYFGVGAIIARRLVTNGHEGTAVSYMISGMGLATVVGVPLGTLLTDTFSWRLAFLLVGVWGLATIICIRRFVPQVGGLEDHGFRNQFAFLRKAAPWLITGGVFCGQMGLYCWYSYVDPMMSQVTGFAASDLSWIMILAGVGMFCGNLAGGYLGDRFKPSLVASAIYMSGAVVLLAIFLGCHIQWLSVALMMCGTFLLFAPGSPMQSSIIVYSKGGELLGAAIVQIAYNLANAIAAMLGGAVIDLGFGYPAVSLTGIPFALLGCALTYTLYRTREHRPSPSGKYQG